MTGPALAGTGGHAGSSRFSPARRRPLRAVAVGAAGLVATVLLLALGAVLADRPGAADRARPAGVLVQYGYRFELPAGWEHTGGLPARRRVLLTPARAPDGRDVIAVERTPLGYDADLERPRAYGELRAEYDAALARGSALAGFEVSHRSGRELLRYVQRDPGGSEVDWFVLLRGTTQLSVGCRHGPATAAAVRAACGLVVDTVDTADPVASGG